MLCEIKYDLIFAKSFYKIEYIRLNEKGKQKYIIL